MEKEPPSTQALSQQKKEEEKEDVIVGCEEIMASCAGGGAEAAEQFEEIAISDEKVSELMEGMSSEEASVKREKFGKNEIPQKVIQWYTILLKQFTGSMAMMIEAAMILALAVQEYSDFAIIAVLLSANASIGFYEEYEALKKVEGIKSSLAPQTTAKRDGQFSKILTADLGPGDVIYLRGGDSVPADIDYLSGDPMSVDTAALTGEPFPRKFPDAKGNRRILGGCMVVSGNSYCLVQRTGIFSEMGSATLLMQQSTKPTQSVFEKSIVEVCELVMTVALFFLVAVYVYMYTQGSEVLDTLTTILSILIAAVPVALPVVMQVTLALGAGEMAKQQAIVTHLTAMQEIASMTMLCSDKTGTLTTAKIKVFFDQIWTTPKYTKEQVMEWCALAANPHATDDPIDVAILHSFREAFPEDFQTRIQNYTVTKFVGFNPEVKRTVAYAKKDEEEIKVSKGLLDKILITGDDGGDTWTCSNAESVRAQVESIDEKFSKSGYKTLGVSVGTHKKKDGSWNMEFAGVVPMLDPPRGDTKEVIEQIKRCGISVKMITGDHQNIAAETARLIGMNDNILKRDILVEHQEGDAKDDVVRKADGFAQVMPRDKLDVVRILMSLNYIVGMTGDGVNDAPALKQAHIGIAVEGSTDAARNAADIVLTTEGLAPIFTAVLESRKIFQRVYSYVLYRISATIQIVLVLSLLIFIYDQTLKPIYVILLALFNDLTMITISYDNVVPSRSPEQPTINKLLRISFVFGILMTVESLLFYEIALHSGLFDSLFKTKSSYRQLLVYLQISVAIESLIFITRTPAQPFFASVPITSLVLSVFVANIAVTVLVTSGLFGAQVSYEDAILVWVYDIVWFGLIDIVKVPLTMTLENYFPAPPSNIGKRTPESSAAHRRSDDVDGDTQTSYTATAHCLEFAPIDLGFTYIADARTYISNNIFRGACTPSSDTNQQQRKQPPPGGPKQRASVV